MIRILDLSMVHNHRPASISITHSRSPAIVLGEECLGVGHEPDLAVPVDIVDLAPRVHDPCVVGCDDDDEVDAFGGELVGLLDEGGKMLRLAAGCECAWGRRTSVSCLDFRNKS